MSYAINDAKGFAEFVEKSPQVVPMGSIEFDDTKALKGDPAVGEATTLVCKQLGISAEDVKKYGCK
jgi:hypothetical protein